MDLSLVIRLLGYVTAILTLLFASYEAWEYFVKGSEVSRTIAIIKIGGPLLASLLSVVILVLTHKNDELTELKNQEKEMELRGVITSLETQLSVEAKTIRNLNVVANIHFSGEWDPQDPPFSEKFYISYPEHMVFVEGIGALSTRLEFYGTKMYRFIETPGGHQLFVVEGTIRPGSWPLGQTIDVIEKMDMAIITMPFVAPAKLKSPRIRIHSALVQIILNDKLTKTTVWEETVNQRRDHVFEPPNAYSENRLVRVPVPIQNGLSDWGLIQK